MNTQVLHCPLCLNTDVNEHCSGDHWPLKGAFYFCNHCSTVFKHPKLFLSSTDEKSRYDLHNNSIEDPRYLQYLQKSWSQFTKNIHLSATATVLDYGCGPVKALEHILQDTPYSTSSWDKFYYNSPLTHPSFDVIFCHEVVEHFTEAQKDFVQLMELTHPGSLLLIRTEFYPRSIEEFKTWYYKNDPTHVVFYQTQSFEYLAQKHQLHIVEIMDGNKVVLQKI